jgi:DNA-directed RNA polymerase subunit K/omega
MILSKKKTEKEEDKPAVSKEDVLVRSQSAYEAVVAIAKEARRLNAAGGVYLEQDEKPIPKAVQNFVDGKVEYEIEEDASTGKKGSKRRKKSK